MATPPDDFGQSLFAMPLVQVGFALGGIGLVWRELRDLPQRVADAQTAAKPGDADATRMAVLSAAVKVLVGGLMMALFGITLLGVSAGLMPSEKALNTFAVLMVPAILVLAYTSLKGVPDAVVKWLLRA